MGWSTFHNTKSYVILINSEVVYIFLCFSFFSHYTLMIVIISVNITDMMHTFVDVITMLLNNSNRASPYKSYDTNV